MVLDEQRWFAVFQDQRIVSAVQLLDGELEESEASISNHPIV